jgi:hypothetical protein
MKTAVPLLCPVINLNQRLVPGQRSEEHKVKKKSEEQHKTKDLLVRHNMTTMAHVDLL